LPKHLAPKPGWASIQGAVKIEEAVDHLIEDFLQNENVGDLLYGKHTALDRTTGEVYERVYSVIEAGLTGFLNQRAAKNA
jgi:hypothetical protein